MVRPKKQSKRLTCHKKYKIIKKVKEHNRKVRKEEKKKVKSNFKPKDPGIPNAYPFKEELLKQIKEKREKEQEEKEDMKAKKAKQVSRKRKLEEMQKSAEKRAKEFEKRHSKELDSTKSDTIESSRKSFYKEFKKVVESSDVVIQVLDARDPMGCRCQEIEDLVMSYGQKKKLVLLLNKIDLIPKKLVTDWLQYLRRSFPAIAFKASTQSQKNKLSQSKVNVDVASSDLLKSATCIGASTLLKLLGNYCRNEGSKSVITVGVVGFPNVGKSSVINSLKRSKTCNVGSTPGVTKNMQEIQLDKHVKLLDSPGIVMATGSTDTQIILRNAVKVEQLEDPIEPVEAILSRCKKSQIMEKYLVADYQDITEFLTLLANRLGRLKKGGVPDTKAAAKVVLHDWNSGKISFCTQVPELSKDKEHEDAKIVHYFGAGFDLKEIEKEEANDLSGLLDKIESSLVIDPGKPGAMVVDEEEEEDDDDQAVDDDSDKEGSEVENMCDSDPEDMTSGETLTKKKKYAETSSKETSAEKSDIGSNENLQLNKNMKKLFKSKQKQKKKEISKLLEEDANRMNDDDDDNYDFSSILSSS